MPNNEVIQAYPLQWPTGWKRTANREFGRFSKKSKVKSNYGDNYYQQTRSISINEGIERILKELGSMGIEREDLVISTNLETRLDGLPRSGQRKPDDPGVAVYWKDGNETRCMAIDMYTDVEQNLAAVAATLYAMRAIERHGGAEILNRAFSGFKALPQSADSSIPNWRDVLELKGNVSIEDVKLQYRAKAKLHHPDTGGDAGAFATLTRAYEMALQELGD